MAKESVNAGLKIPLNGHLILQLNWASSVVTSCCTSRCQKGPSITSHNIAASVSCLVHFISLYSTSSYYNFISCRPTRVQRVRWNIGSSGLCCLAWICGSPSTLHSGSPRTYCQCNLSLAASWKMKKRYQAEKRGGNWIIKNIWSLCKNSAYVHLGNTLTVPGLLTSCCYQLHRQTQEYRQ